MFNCSADTNLFTYQQTVKQLQENSAYFIIIKYYLKEIIISSSEAVENVIKISDISSAYSNLGITMKKVVNGMIIDDSNLQCSSQTPVQPCTFEIKNNCPIPVSFYNYYDQISFILSGYLYSNQNYTYTQQKLTYNIICDNTFQTNTFQWGINILIILSTIIISIAAVYSRAWSIKGQGITFNYCMMITLNILIIIAAIFGFFFISALNVILQVLAWIMTIICMSFCINQILFLFKGSTKLKQCLYKVLYQYYKKRNISQESQSSIQKPHNILYTKLCYNFSFLCYNNQQDISIKIYIADLISFFISLGFTILWWFIYKNWIISDIINICMIISVIKIIKFTSLKIAVISFIVTSVNQMIIILVTYFIFSGKSQSSNQTNYNNILINKLNNPFYLQLPTINGVYNQKCAWLPITAIVFPGILLAYFRRFDTSRNTHLYIILGIVVFVIGSILWQVSSLASPFDLPFGLITQPATLGLVCIFATQRKQMRTLWEGKFYDEQFADKDALKNLEMQVMQDYQYKKYQYGQDKNKKIDQTNINKNDNNYNYSDNNQMNNSVSITNKIQILNNLKTNKKSSLRDSMLSGLRMGQFQQKMNQKYDYQDEPSQVYPDQSKIQNRIKNSQNQHKNQESK